MLIGVAAVTALLLGTVVTTVGSGEPDETRTPSPLPDREATVAEVAVDLAAQARSADEKRRTEIVRQTVLDSRAVDFLEEFDRRSQDQQARWKSISYTPVAYRVAVDNGKDARVLVLSRVERTAHGKSETEQVWDLSGFGVVSKFERWWVFSYAGSTTEYAPGDSELDGFVELDGADMSA